MKVPIEILVVTCLLVGILPALTVSALLHAAAAATLNGTVPYYDLAIWHGFNAPLLMSVLAMAGGGVLYSLRRPLFALHARLPTVDGRRLFNLFQFRLIIGSGILLRRLDNGSLTRYLAILVGAAVAACIGALVHLPALAGPIARQRADAPAVLGALLTALAALTTVAWQRRRLRALLALGATGLMVTLTFVRFSAPDLALTQLAVEIATLLLMLLALHYLPQSAPHDSSVRRRFGDGALALAAGAVTFALTLAVLTRPVDPISRFFVERSLSEGGGANIVNVILVDFRAFDTLGEITVLTIAALASVALLDNLALDSPNLRERAGDRHPVVLAQLARALLPLALLLSFYLFLRGHQRPGGGFVAGLVTACAFALQYVAQGEAWTEARVRVSYRRLAGAGVLFATLTGLGSWLPGYPFLTSTFGHVRVPLLGEIELASALLFDFGVYCAVIGVTLLLLSRLGRLRSAVASREHAPWK